MTQALDELEQRVGEKYLAALSTHLPEWTLPDVEFDMSEWADLEPLPPGTMQFPREQWAVYPNRRATTLCIVDRLLDFLDELTDEQWLQLSFLWHYGGKTRLV